MNRHQHLGITATITTIERELTDLIRRVGHISERDHEAWESAFRDQWDVINKMRKAANDGLEG